MGYSPRATLDKIGQYPTMKIWQKRLEDRIKLSGHSMKSVSVEAGLGATWVRDVLKRDKSPTLENMEAVAKVLDVSVGWLLGESGSGNLGNTPDLPALPAAPPNYVPVRFLEAKGGMGGGQIPEEAWGAPRYFEAGLLASLRADPDDLGAMEVEGQSMESILFSGDQILFHRRRVNVSEPGIFVLWDGDGIVCKWVERVHRSDPPKLRIFSENARFKDYEVLAEEAVIHGRVIWFARRM